MVESWRPQTPSGIALSSQVRCAKRRYDVLDYIGGSYRLALTGQSQAASARSVPCEEDGGFRCWLWSHVLVGEAVGEASSLESRDYSADVDHGTGVRGCHADFSQP